MKLIAHRGNINGKNPLQENSPFYIEEALNKGYDVEIDVWYLNNKFYLGHDEPSYNINVEFLQNNKLWCHAKTLDSLYKMLEYQYLGDNDSIHCFWHQTDQVTLTSQNYIWTFPGYKLFDSSICVLPEKANYTEENLKNCAGICSDYIEKYKFLLK